MTKQAMIFAAGLGTRLKPVTDSIPKALVEINGMPMLDRVISNLTKAGIERIIVNVHHFADKVIDHLKTLGNLKAEIMISDERDLLLDTAGGIRKALGQIDIYSPLLVHNADILTDLDLSAMYHDLDGSDALLLCSSERSTSRHLLFDDALRLKGWGNDSTGEIRPAGLEADGLHKMAFGGIHLLGPAILDAIRKDLPADQPSPIVPYYLSICNKYCLSAYSPGESYQWHDIGSLEKLNRAISSFRESSND